MEYNIHELSYILKNCVDDNDTTRKLNVWEDIYKLAKYNISELKRDDYQNYVKLF